MAVDKLVDSTQLNADLTSIANAIRTKGSTSAQLAFPSGFVSAINDLEVGDMWTEQTISTAGAVTQALDPYVIYHFTGALTSLTVTLTAAAQGQIPHYHFDFASGSTAPTLNVPQTVTMQSGFSVEASKHYEIDILNNYGTAMGW